MRTYKETTEIICFTEEEAKQVIEDYRKMLVKRIYHWIGRIYLQDEKAKGEIIGELWLVKITEILESYGRN